MSILHISGITHTPPGPLPSSQCVHQACTWHAQGVRELMLQGEQTTWAQPFIRTCPCPCLQAVSLSAGGFENRRSLPSAWRGVRDDALSQLSGIPDCVFVHAGGFIGACVCAQ